MKGGKVLGKGRDGCVTDETLLCSTNLDKKDYNDKVSKVIDVSNSDARAISTYVQEYESGEIFRNYDKNSIHFLPGLEMCYKKYHELNTEQRRDMSKCNYNTEHYNSLYLNIILQKGLSFQKITSQLNYKNVLKSMGYLLTGAKKSIYDLNILLLDVKPDNLLYVKKNDELYPVFIDFSDDFVITNRSKLDTFLNGFSGYYPYWTLETFYVFLFNLKKKNQIKTIKKLKSDIFFYDGVDLNAKKYEPTLNGIKKYSNRLLKGELSDKELKEFYEKQFVYSIGVSFKRSLEKNKKDKKTQIRKDIEELLWNMTDPNLFNRPNMDTVFNEIKKIGLKNNLTFNNREDYIINKKVNDGYIIPKQVPKIKSLTKKSSIESEKKLSESIKIIAKINKKEKNKRKNKNIEKSKVNYDLNNLKQNYKKLKKSELLKIVDDFKKDKCKKGIQKLKKKELIDLIKKLSPKEDLNSYTLTGLRTLYKSLSLKVCNIKKTDKKIKYIKYIEENIF